MIAGKRVSPELRLVESKSVIESPVVSHHCQLVEPLGVSGVLFDQETLEDGSNGSKMLETLKASGLKIGCLGQAAPRFPDIETRAVSPQALAELIQQWGVEASAVLVVGASVNVIRVARGSGSLTVALLKPRGWGTWMWGGSCTCPVPDTIRYYL